MSQADVIAEAIEKGGGVTVIAKALGMSEEGVRLWRVRGKVPDKRLLDFERLTGVSRIRLRPDLYAPSPEPTPQQAASGAHGGQMR